MHSSSSMGVNQWVDNSSISVSTAVTCQHSFVVSTYVCGSERWPRRMFINFLMWIGAGFYPLSRQQDSRPSLQGAASGNSDTAKNTFNINIEWYGKFIGLNFENTMKYFWNMKFGDEIPSYLVPVKCQVQKIWEFTFHTTPNSFTTDQSYIYIINLMYNKTIFKWISVNSRNTSLPTAKYQTQNFPRLNISIPIFYTDELYELN